MCENAVVSCAADMGWKIQKGGRMEYFLQQLINGVTLGSIYGLIAIGYTMVYGIIGMINFAHGDVFMVGSVVASSWFWPLALPAAAEPSSSYWRWRWLW